MAISEYGAHAHSRGRRVLTTHVVFRRTDGGFYFVCDHGKHGNAKRYNCGCNFVSSLSRKLHQKSYRLAKITWLHNFITQAQVETPQMNALRCEGGRAPGEDVRTDLGALLHDADLGCASLTPNLPTKIIPTKIC